MELSIIGSKIIIINPISAAIINSKDKYFFKFQDWLCQKKDCRFIHKLMTADQRKESGMDQNLNKEKKLNKFKNGKKNEKSKNKLLNNDKGMHNKPNVTDA